MNNKLYRVVWTPRALDELARMYGYPPNIKESIYRDSLRRLSFWPTVPAKQIPYGELMGLWVRQGKYDVTLIFEVEHTTVWVMGVKHKRQDKYWLNE
ncbi:hypothetical protein SY88_16870 [Clostridiales bacterium PH28_bin88]|nr:hypothetical protein SY88_16870 [Clostridiales bacterium PH28_bin88]